MTKLFSEAQLGTMALKNRIVMSPMTRCRSIGNVPGELTKTYYEQRATAGLIVTEGTAPSPNGLGYTRIPGLYRSEQAKAWRHVTDAVHQKGGKIFVQLMHTGRVSHPLNMPAGARVVGPSAVALSGNMHTDAQGPQSYPVPEAMTATDIEQAIEEYVHSSALAVNEAGFDGVELHGANGYLIDQFLNTASNQRTDEWGGTVEGRIRFAVEVAKRVTHRIGPDKVGIRLSPYGAASGMVADADTDSVYQRLAKELSSLKLVYVHLVDHSAMGAPKPKPELVHNIRKLFAGSLISAGGYDAVRAEADLVEGKADFIAFGRPFISNPDLVERLRTGAPLAAPDMATFYTPGAEGYTDYPTL